MKTRDSRLKMKLLLPSSYFWLFFGTLLMIGGVHMGLFYLLQALQVRPIWQSHLMLLYWVLVSWLLSIEARKRIQKTYDEPMRKLAEASRKVAGGDFSVYVPTVHTADRYDYLDEMILDFNKMVEELGSIETLKTDFFTNVSHEMKTPLAVISNNAQLLANNTISEERRRECTENIRVASRRMNSLITNMLKLNKLEKQTIKPAPERYDLCEQLAECIFQYEELLEERQLELAPQLEDRCFVCADSELMNLVWTNLISNAVKFTPNGGMITITQVSHDGIAEVSIADTGCGMDEITQKHIFEKFYQGDTSHATAGNGLGLALVKRILELSEGTISVQSTVGKGSIFTVSIPLAEEQKHHE
jgi:signal transduction histidine kinase